MCVAGCQRGPLPTSNMVDAQQQAAAAPSAEQQKMLEDILKYQQETGSSLEVLAKDIAARKAQDTDGTGTSVLVRDLAVARGLLVAVRRSVNNEESEAALRSLRRLAQTVRVMQGETPAARVCASLERANAALVGSEAGIEADVASAAVLSAMNVALKSPDAPLVPNIGLGESLEKAKGQIDKGEYKEALTAIGELVQTVLNHESVRRLDRIAAGVQGAREAMERGAGLVVMAELDQLSDGFNRFATALRGQPASTETKAGEAGKAAEAPKAADNTAPASNSTAAPATENAVPAAAAPANSVAGQ